MPRGRVEYFTPAGAQNWCALLLRLDEVEAELAANEADFPPTQERLAKGLRREQSQLSRRVRDWRNALDQRARWPATLAVEEAEASVRHAHQLVQEAKLSLSLAESEHASEIKTLQEERNRLSKILEPSLARYKEAKEHNSGDAFANITNSSCAGCNEVLPAYVVVDVTRGSLRWCLRCKRILVVDTDSAGATGQLSWEVLPLGWWRDPVFVSGLGSGPGWKQGPRDVERLRRLAQLNPAATYQGLYLGRRQYIVFVFDGVAIAECPTWGNALYYTIDPDWRSVFALTKRDAIRLGARRIFHRGDWFARAAALVARQA